MTLGADCVVGVQSVIRKTEIQLYLTLETWHPSHAGSTCWPCWAMQRLVLTPLTLNAQSKCDKWARLLGVKVDTTTMADIWIHISFLLHQTHSDFNDRGVRG